MGCSSQRLARIAHIRFLKGDLDDAKGAPVKTGQALFEIAPLETLRLKLAVDEADIGWVRAGMPVSGRLEGTGGRTVAATITRIHPQAELSHEENVFMAEADLADATGSLRPGMRGKGRIASDRRPLGWIWWHKAWHKFRLWIG